MKALDEICKIYTLFHRSQIQYSAEHCNNIQYCEHFEIAAVQNYANLVELEKCCQTHIFLQNFVLIQPRTNPPKICKILQNGANFAEEQERLLPRVLLFVHLHEREAADAVGSVGVPHLCLH